jgi:hypothetical protein
MKEGVVYMGGGYEVRTAFIGAMWDVGLMADGRVLGQR